MSECASDCALSAQSAAGFFLATALAGSGFGAGFQGAVRTVLPTAKAHERAGVLSVVFVVSYLAMGLPAIVAGFFVSRGSALLATAQNFGALVAVLSALAIAGILSGRLSAAKAQMKAGTRPCSPPAAAVVSV